MELKILRSKKAIATLLLFILSILIGWFAAFYFNWVFAGKSLVIKAFESDAENVYASSGGVQQAGGGACQL